MSLVIHKTSLPARSVFEFIDKLQRHVLFQQQQSSWPGGGTLLGTETVVYLRCDEQVLACLKSVATGLYDWVHPLLPEDLAFYREDDSPLLATIGHEHAAFMMLHEAEYDALMEAVPRVKLTEVAPI